MAPEQIKTISLDIQERIPITVSVSMKLFMHMWNGRLLLVLHKNGQWGLPAGGIKSEDETLGGAIRREVAEETGYPRVILL